MKPTLARLLIRLYPRPWRERYGVEVEALLEDGLGDLGSVANVIGSALYERMVPTRGLKMKQDFSFVSVAKQPSAFLPVAMSLTALAMVLGDFATHGIARGGDEGAVAHLWQLLMAAQMPVLLYFAIKWLRKAPRQTLQVLALQAGGIVANLALIFLSGVG